MHLYEVRSLPLWIQPIFLMKYGTDFVIFGMIHQHAIFFMNCHFLGSGELCAGLQPGFMIWMGKIHFYGGNIFVFILLLYVQNKFFWEQQSLGDTKIWGVTAPECIPVATGLAVRESYPQLSELAFRILLPLPQYLCERGFPALAHIKPETRNQSRVEHEIRSAPPNTQPQISKLAVRLQSLLSH